uniref:1-phosphatidylinositol 4-kinase n=1 Tax=Arcella intermedia TaxID=1963864 RepID=A0A6B2L004_9EUKA
MFHSTDGYLRDGLCKQLNALYQCFPSEVEFYLCQLLNILLHNKNFKVLADFIFDKCRESQHFATQTCFLLSAMGDHGSTRWINKCKKLLVKVEASIPADDRVKEKLELPPPEENGTVPPTPEKEKKDKKESTEGGESGIEPEMSPKIRKPFARATRRAGKDYFFQNLNFLKELVAISQKLTQKFSQPELYVSELQKNLEGLNKFIEDGVAFMPSYSTARHLVLKVNSELCYPIPTFGRVLYYLMMEVVAIPGSLVQPQGVKEYMSTLMEGNQVPDEKENSTVDGNDEYENSENTDPGLVSAFGENWIQRCKRLRAQSEFGKLLGWDSCAYIIKQGDFVLQEQFVMQMFVQFQRIFDKERVPIRLRIYRIMALSSDSGIIEVVPNALSVDKLKQQMEGGNLRNFFKQQWPDKADYNKATTNFVQSLAAYSLVCYFLQIKDRHNGNIMMDTDGNLLHIDFGYLLTRTIEFEKAPFKLTEEFIDVIGGEKSKLFQRYEELCVQGFFAIRKHYRKILTLVEMTMTQPIMGGQFLPCLNKGSVLKNLRKRFHLEDNTRIEALVKDLIKESRDNWRTNIYDAYQNILQGIRC